MNEGKIILLNGTSSAGKSTTAQAVQAIMNEPYLHTGVDHYQLAFPPNLVNIKATGKGKAVGWDVVYGETGLQSIQIGAVGKQLIRGMYKMIAALSDTGINVVVDDVIWNIWILDAAVSMLHNYPVYFIALDLSLEASIEREQKRGNRGPGNAQFFYPRVYGLNDVYDARIDVENCHPDECAQLVKSVVAKTTSSAFKTLYQKFNSI